MAGFDKSEVDGNNTNGQVKKIVTATLPSSKNEKSLAYKEDAISTAVVGPNDSPRRKLIENHAKEALLSALTKELDGEKILQAYKKSRGAEEVEQQASRVLGLNSRNDSTKSEKMLCLQNILAELKKLCDDDLKEAALKTCGHELNASQVLDFLKPEELREALLK